MTQEVADNSPILDLGLIQDAFALIRPRDFLVVHSNRAFGRWLGKPVCQQPLSQLLPEFQLADFLYNMRKYAEHSFISSLPGTGLKDGAEVLFVMYSVQHRDELFIAIHGYLPARLQVLLERSLGMKKESLPSLATIAGKVETVNVLVAEDNPMNQKVILRILQGRNCQVTLTENGRECVEAWSKGTFDLVLMDLQMPDINGFEATRMIRKKEATNGAHIPIIAVSGNLLAEDQSICLQAGMDGFLPKPVSKTKLLELYDRLMSL